MVRGSYKKGVFEDERIAKVILLLATRAKTKEHLTDLGIKAATWDNSEYGYRKRLMEANLIGEKDTNKIGKRGVIKEYIFRWGSLLDGVFNVIYKDIEENNKTLTETYKNSKEKADKDKKELENQYAYYKRRISKLKLSNASYEELPENLKRLYTKFFKKKRNYRTHLLLQKEFDAQQNNINSFLNRIKNIPTELNTYDKNWFICQLISYFNESLLVQTKKSSIEELIRRFLLAIANNGKLPMRFPPEMQSYPFKYEKVNKNLILSLLEDYRKFKDINVEWLIIFKPMDTIYWEKATEEHERQMAEEDMKRAEEWDKEFSKSFNKAKTLDERYGVVFDYYGEETADKFLNDEIDKLREPIKNKEVTLQNK